MNDTIFALATAPGRAAIAVVRCSGPDAGGAARTLGTSPPPPRRATLRTLRDATGAILDRAMMLWFPAPRSYTGEDCVELHLHGGLAVVDAVAEALIDGGLRPAEPGEFTRRAVLNGKLDLGQAEAVADLIDAESRAQARQALAQVNGALGRRCDAWRADLLAAMAFLEGGVDFTEDLDEAGFTEKAGEPIRALITALEVGLTEERRGRRVREGYRVAIIGPPNAGKSSLLNRLLGRGAAIVTETPGTTRDVLEHPLDLAGFRILLADTAGFRAADDPIEQEGMKRASAWARTADLRVIVVDRNAGGDIDQSLTDLAMARDFVVLNKADLPAGPLARKSEALAREIGGSSFQLQLTAPEPRPVDWVRFDSALQARVVADCGGGEVASITRARHGRLLREARAHLVRSLDALGEPEMAAEDVRLAGRALERITGGVGVEDVLGEIFQRFCIGK